MGIDGKMEMKMVSIRRRISISFIFIILLTIFTFGILILNIMKQNYYQNIEDRLKSQLRVSASIYLRYFSDNSLYDNILNNVDTFWNQSDVQVQILDTNGKVLMDSIGALWGENEIAPDVEKALKEGSGTWTGVTRYDKDSVMAVSWLLTSEDSVVGVLRFITSLKDVNNQLNKVTLIFAFIGLVVAILAVLVSLFLTRTISGPLREVTQVAEKMAQGDYKVKSKKTYNDEIGKLSDTLNYMASEILKREKLKNEFISSISHELRTPLTSIKGWAATLRDLGNDMGNESLDQGKRQDKMQDEGQNQGQDQIELLEEGLEIIETECDRLSIMVDELLNYSRLISGRTNLDNAPVNIEELLCHVVRQLTPRAEDEKIKINLKTQPDLPSLNTDANKLKQVFINILDNAIKFNRPAGHVTIETEKNNDNLIIKVIDTGVGIAPNELPEVKQKFFKGKNSKDGNGIGLSVCDEIISLIGGTLEIKSVVNIGSEVVITLPCEDKDEGSGEI
jgi:signal transduction histidine kinase